MEVGSCPVLQNQMQCNFLQYASSQFTFTEENFISLSEERSGHKQIKAGNSNPNLSSSSALSHRYPTDFTGKDASVKAYGCYCITRLSDETRHVPNHFHISNISAPLAALLSCAEESNPFWQGMGKQQGNNARRERWKGQNKR